MCCFSAWRFRGVLFKFRDRMAKAHLVAIGESSSWVCVMSDGTVDHLNIPRTLRTCLKENDSRTMDCISLGGCCGVWVLIVW